MIRTNKMLQIKFLYHLKVLNLISQRNISVLPPKHICLCGHVLKKQNQRQAKIIFNNARVHSTHSDQHRQKVVIETTSPKIVIDKLSLGKVLPVDGDLEHRKQVWKDKILPYAQLSRWDKPIGVYLLYWPCAWSIALGSIPGTVPLQTTLQTAALFLVGAGLMRGAGCTINDMWDKDVDAQVERTKDRPLVSGAVSQTGATVFLGAQLSLALAVLLQLNCFSVALGASSMMLVVTYPLAKRFTNYPQIFLGATFNWGALLGYSAIQGSIDPSICLPMYFGALAWTVIYDTIYAHQDKSDDARIGMKSTALTFGAHTRPALTAALAFSAACFSYAGAQVELGVAYAAAVTAYVARAGHQIYTLNTEDPNDCAAKFKANSLVGLIILLGIIGGGYEKYMENRRKNEGVENLNVTKSCFFS